MPQPLADIAFPRLPRTLGQWIFGLIVSVMMAALPSASLAAQDGHLTGILKPVASNTLSGEIKPLTDFMPPAGDRSAPRRLDSGQVEVTLPGDGLDKPPAIIRADEIEADLNRNFTHFIGRVSISRGPETITADRALWNDRTNTVELSGHLKIETPDFIIMADRAAVNLDLNLAKIYNGKAFFPAQNYYLSGALLERLGERTIHIEDGTATTCDGPNPAWTIHADKLTVTEGGYATASGASFNTRHFPLIKMPWFVFPVKNERQSGLLFPSVSTSSRDGLTVSLPVFWATGENHDLTYTPVWRTDRGLSSTLEGRYHLARGRGVWQFTYLGDNKPQRYEYIKAQGGQEAQKRYWLRTQNQWRVGEWDINLNLDMVSDPLYLSEFRSDLDGFFRSFELFNQEFGYTLNEYLDPLRSNTFFAQRTGYDTLVRGGLEYTDNLYSRDNADTIQRLPSLKYSLVGRPLFDGGAEDGTARPRVSLDMNYDYFFRTVNENSTTTEKGHRLYFNPSLWWSNSLGGLATLELNGNLDLAMYDATGRRSPLSSNIDVQPPGTRHDGRENRLSGSLEATLSSTLSRVYGGGPGEALATRHQITPTVSFINVEAPDDQSDLPYWDPLDRQLSRRTVRYGVLNTFVSKTAVTGQDGAQTGHEYFQFLKLGLWSSYEFTDPDWPENRDDTRYPGTEYYEQGIGPVEVEIEAFFNPFLSARLVSGMDGQTGEVTSHDLSFRVQDPRGDSLTVAYDFDSAPEGRVDSAYTNEYVEYEEIRADLGIVLNSEWRADISTRYDLHAGKDLETHARLMYQAQCYGLGILYSDSDNDRRVGLVVDLLGLGSINYDQRGLAAPPALFYQ